MKISKSFKIYIHIILLYLISHNLYGAEDFSKNIVIHEKPTQITELKFKDSDLNDVDLTNKKGNIMILNFWATWCAPCKKEMPSLDRLQVHEDLNNLMIFPINVGQENLQKSSKFFEDLKINNLNIYFDTQVTLAKKFGLRGIPTTILFDKNGLEFARIIGSIDFEDEKFIKWLSKFN